MPLSYHQGCSRVFVQRTINFYFSLVNLSFVSLIYRVPVREPKRIGGKVFLSPLHVVQCPYIRSLFILIQPHKVNSISPILQRRNRRSELSNSPKATQLTTGEDRIGVQI